MIAEPAVLVFGGINELYFEAEKLPRFEYYGERIDTFKLYNNQHYNLFLGAYIALQVWLLLFIADMIFKIKNKRTCYLFLILFCTNFYIMSQVVFAWPKIITGYLLLIIYLNMQDEKADLNDKIAQAALVSGIAIHFHMVGGYVLLFAIGMVILEVYKKFGFKFLEALKRIDKFTWIMIISGGVFWCIEMARPIYLGIQANLYSQNNLQGLSLIGKLPVAIKSIVVYFTFEPTIFKSAGWCTYIGTMLPATISLHEGDFRKFMHISYLAVAAELIIAIVFENPIPAFSIGMQFIMPMLLCMIATYSRSKKMFISAICLQVVMWSFFSLQIYLMGRTNIDTVIKFTLFPLLMIGIAGIINIKQERLWNALSCLKFGGRN